MVKIKVKGIRKASKALQIFTNLLILSILGYLVWTIINVDYDTVMDVFVLFIFIIFLSIVLLLFLYLLNKDKVFTKELPYISEIQIIQDKIIFYYRANGKIVQKKEILYSDITAFIMDIEANIDQYNSCYYCNSTIKIELLNQPSMKFKSEGYEKYLFSHPYKFELAIIKYFKNVKGFSCTITGDAKNVINDINNFFLCGKSWLKRTQDDIITLICLFAILLMMIIATVMFIPITLHI